MQTEFEAKFPDADMRYQELLKILCTAFYEQMSAQSIENYMELNLQHEGGRGLVVTVRWKEGLTPVQKYNNHLALIRAELASNIEGRLNVLQQLDELKAFIEAAPPEVQTALGWLPPNKM